LERLQAGLAKFLPLCLNDSYMNAAESHREKKAALNPAGAACTTGLFN